jgi:hydrogenase expression/formation protein HypE
MPESFPLGKLPADVLADLLARYPVRDPRVILGPSPGEDATVLDLGSCYLVAKTDPITFATDEIGWYVVNVNANDIAATGGTPTWFMATLLLPEGRATRSLVDSIFDQMHTACEALNITLVGGHSEITYGIDRPIVVGMMLGLAGKDELVTTGGVQTGDVLLVTKGIPIEATAIIAREKAGVLRGKFDPDFLARCAAYLHTPGIGVVNDAVLARQAGRVHAMHDPTEGGLATGLWEMADAAGKRLVVDPAGAILEDGRLLCEATGLDPLGAIASGALLLAVHPGDVAAIRAALEAGSIAVYEIGHAEDGPAEVIISASGKPLHRPARDEITRLFER